jgi:hypothetical protein
LSLNDVVYSIVAKGELKILTDRSRTFETNPNLNVLEKAFGRVGRNCREKDITMAIVEATNV